MLPSLLQNIHVRPQAAVARCDTEQLTLTFAVFSSTSLSLSDVSQVLAGEEADITPSMLSTEDGDTPAEELVYHVEGPTGGMLALKEAPEEGILNFTQAHIDKGEVIFIHEGAATDVSLVSMSQYGLNEQCEQNQPHPNSLSSFR